MSEYQYYEFLALDRVLDESEIAQLGQLSSRARISPTRFVNVYNYGDFRGDVNTLMSQYFDAMVYVANWGTHQFMVRLPRDVVDITALRAYCVDDYCASVAVSGDVVVFNFNSNPEDYGDWEDGEGYLQPLLPVRDEMLRGDLRAPYLAWLMCVQFGDVDEDDTEPFVPPGLKQLSPALQSLADYLRIDQDLLAAAAEHSPDQSGLPDGLADWIAALPVERKNQLLLQLVEGTELQLGAKLLQQYRSTLADHDPAQRRRRTVAELRAAAERLEQVRKAEERRHAEEEQAQRDLIAAAEREKRLRLLALRGDDAWRSVERLVELKQAKAYQEAAGLITDLREISERENKTKQFQERLAELRERHQKKRTLWQLLKQSGVTD